jgi:hypothetical protein
MKIPASKRIDECIQRQDLLIFLTFMKIHSTVESYGHIKPILAVDERDLVGAKSLLRFPLAHIIRLLFILRVL